MEAGQKIGVYLLLEWLGAGGIGEVWKARDSRLNRIVALKFISAQAPGSAPMVDLLREARAASALNHPNIITIYDIGQAEARTYLAMEFVEGETLRARLKRPPVPLEEALEVAAQVASGLAAAHRGGIVHRDLKPENIMVRADGLIKVLDFGLAKVMPQAQATAADDVTETGSLLTESGQLIGTLTYMSPEQARGKHVTPSSDVFSFGIVLFELLTGAHPFRAATPMDTVMAILNKTPEPVSAHSSAIPAEIEHVVGRALSKEPSARFASAVELAAELQAVRTSAGNAAAGALPPLRQQPRWKQAIGAALITLLLSLGAWFYHRPSSGAKFAPSVDSVAVMNFRADGDDTRAANLAHGLPEELNGTLARTGLRVASAGSVLALPGAADPRAVGAQLGVDAVLDGSVRAYGGLFKVHVELVSTRTGFQIWSGTFTTQGDDPLDNEQKTAARIAEELHAAVKE